MHNKKYEEVTFKLLKIRIGECKIIDVSKRFAFKKPIQKSNMLDNLEKLKSSYTPKSDGYQQ